MNLTPVFPPEVLPVREGVYLTTQVDPMTGVAISEQTEYSLFDLTSKIWGCGHPTPAAATKTPDFEFAWQHKSWQGLTKEVA